MISFVIGNGTSRSSINLDDLSLLGPTYGCNALYRDFYPTYLISVDLKMIEEINKVGYQHSHEVWINSYPQTKYFKNFNYFVPRLGWSSGPCALHLASKHTPTDIYIIGFDYIGNNGLLNNVYANSDNYKKSTDIATYYGNWQQQTNDVISKNPHINYYRVVNKHNYYSLNFKNQNYKEIFLEDFDKLKNELKIKETQKPLF